MPRDRHVPDHGPAIASDTPTNWTKAGTPRKVGRYASDRVRMERPLTRQETDALIREVRHSLCVEHVAMEGLREPICITKRDDRDAILASVRELLP